MNDEGSLPPDLDSESPIWAPLGERDRAGRSVDDGRARVFPCEQCGADLVFDIGQQTLKCRHCGFEKELDLAEEAQIREQDFHAALDRLQEIRTRGLHEEPDHQEVRCNSCGANVVFEGTLTSSECPYCGSPIQRENVHSATWRIPVDGVLPFLVDHQTAGRKLKEWVASRWFAPNDFLKRGAEGKFEGVYLPYWTFDSLTFNVYKGERGDHYWVTVGTGKNRQRVRKTRWSHASGRFQRFFDDVLICATNGLPEQYIRSLEPWPLHQCLPFTQQVLAGHFARTYEIELESGFAAARKIMDDMIRAETRRRIGGDEQRIHSLNSRYDAITFKHLLLPLWMLVYRHRDKSYRVFINGGTGEVQGERPYSWVKILFAVLGILAVILGIVAVSQGLGGARPM